MPHSLRFLLALVLLCGAPTGWARAGEEESPPAHRFDREDVPLEGVLEALTDEKPLALLDFFLPG